MNAADETRGHILVCVRIMREYFAVEGHEDWHFCVTHSARVALAASVTRQALDSGIPLYKRILFCKDAFVAFAVAKALAQVEDARNGIEHTQSADDVAVERAMMWANSVIADEVRGLEVSLRRSRPRTSRPPQ